MGRWGCIKFGPVVLFPAPMVMSGEVDKGGKGGIGEEKKAKERGKKEAKEGEGRKRSKGGGGRQRSKGGEEDRNRESKEGGQGNGHNAAHRRLQRETMHTFVPRWVMFSILVLKKSGERLEGCDVKSHIPSTCLDVSKLWFSTAFLARQWPESPKA